MRTLLFAGLAAALAWADPAAAELFSATRPIIAIVAGDIYVGEAEGHLSGAGTLAIRAQADPGLTCFGEFTSSAELGGEGQLRCSDGAVASFAIRRLTVFSGHGNGKASRGAMSFTYGMTVEQSQPNLTVPAGKKLVRSGTALVLVDARQPPGV